MRVAVLLAWLLAAAQTFAKDGLLLLVADPLARDLACACVKGFGQRDYRKLQAHLQKATGEKVSIEFTDDVPESIALADKGQRFLVIGDRSVVEAGMKKANVPARAIAELTDQEGQTELAGAIIVRSGDSARELKDLGKRKVFAGLPEDDAKFAAALTALKAGGVEVTETKHSAYSDAALDMLDSDEKPLPIVVAPSYAVKLLEACGSVRPGNLRIIARTEPAPFITVFASENVRNTEKLAKALLDVKKDSALLTALESKEGFKAIDDKKTAEAWPDWRGPNRDGKVAKLPERLPSAAKVIWKKAMVEGALAGISVSGDRVILAERDLADENDVYRCLEANTGELVWRIHFPAKGNLDYGNSTRAAPVFDGGNVLLLSAFGQLRCVSAATGRVIWERDLPKEFGAKLPTWGMCAPPLVADDLVIVNPGVKNASLMGLDKATGKTRWQTAGAGAAYGAFICAELGGQRQVIGYDENSLGGWNPKTGERLWRLAPPVSGDFNVPTPIVFEGGLIVATENNGTRRYEFDAAGRIIAKPAAVFADLSPETTSPVVTSGKVFGADDSIYCLDARTFQKVWLRDEALGDHASLIADEERVLVMTLKGELILLDAKTDDFRVLSRLKLFENDVEAYSHPAVVGHRLYARAGENVLCVDLTPGTEQVALLPKLKTYADEVAAELNLVSAERREVLDKIAADVSRQLAARRRADLTFICTHNSRRSHMSQIWAQTAAHYYGMTNVQAYSGGTQETACNSRTIMAMRRAGFAIEDATTGENPLYLVSYAEGKPPVRAYSKLYHADGNPTEGFIALMTCSSADKTCPIVKGSIARHAIHYADPRLCDDTPTETQAYNERCREIAREMFYIMRHAQARAR